MLFPSYDGLGVLKRCKIITIAFFLKLLKKRSKQRNR